MCPTFALVAVGPSSRHALGLVDRIVDDGRYPVIALLSAEDPELVREAAEHGIYAYVLNTTAGELQGAIDITVRRFAEFHELQGALGRRFVIEQAKGILMGRHAIDADTAFAMLRDHSQHSGLRLADVAAALVQSHTLLASPAVNGPSTGAAARAGQRAG